MESHPLTLTVVVDNESWILPYARELVDGWREDGHRARLCRAHDEVPGGDVAFYLGCISIAPREVLDRNPHNFVVHESDLPQGRGFAPLAWQVLAESNDIPIVLFEATDEPDAGPVYLRDTLHFDGHELLPELRDVQATKTVALCRDLVLRYPDITGEPQRGEPSQFARRRPADSRLDPDRTLREQFALLRTVDNERFPAYFEMAGHRYVLQIHKDE
jgi:methionyl-tRNA formyltransferase